MKTRQANSFDMYGSVLDFLRAYGSELSPVPALAAAITEYEEAYQHLEDVAQRQSERLRPALAQRDHLLEELTHATMVLAGAVGSFAMERRDATLAAAVHVRRSDFVRTRFVRRASLARRVHEAAVPLIGQLEPYGITPAVLADFEARIVAAENAVSLPRATVTARMAATIELRASLRRLGDFVRRRLDPLIYPLSRTNPRLYEHYRAVRLVVHRRGTHEAATVESAPIDAAAA